MVSVLLIAAELSSLLFNQNGRCRLAVRQNGKDIELQGLVVFLIGSGVYASEAFRLETCFLILILVAFHSILSARIPTSPQHNG